MSKPGSTLSKLEITYVALADLQPADYNPRQIADPNLQRLTDSLSRFGVVDPIIARRNGLVIGGHQRLKAAQALGLTEVPVVYLDLDDTQAKALNVALNNPALQGEWDNEKLAVLLGELQEKAVLEWTGFEDNDLDALLARIRQPIEGLTDPDAIPEDVEPITKPGDLWLLGNHRLLCGDSTKAEDVERLLDGGQVDLGLTSPPYAVGKEYERGVSFSAHLEMLQAIAYLGLQHIKPGMFFFINFGEIAAQSHAGPLTGSTRQCIYAISQDYYRIFRGLGYELYAQRIWYKPFNRLQQPFWTYHTSIPHHQEWEHIWTWRLPGGQGDAVHDWDISSRAVWDTRNEATEDKPLTRHVAAFPVCLPERAMKAHSTIGGTIWEPFGGSGTTIIAAERLGRTSYSMEIDPHYCDVAVQRFLQYRGDPGIIFLSTDSGDIPYEEVRVLRGDKTVH